MLHDDARSISFSHSIDDHSIDSVVALLLGRTLVPLDLFGRQDLGPDQVWGFSLAGPRSRFGSNPVRVVVWVGSTAVILGLFLMGWVYHHYLSQIIYLPLS